MSGRNFYNAMTPGSSIGHAFGKGKGSYMIINEDDLDAEWMTSQNQIPGPKDGLLNEINKNGLMTYTGIVRIETKSPSDQTLSESNVFLTTC